MSWVIELFRRINTGAQRIGASNISLSGFLGAATIIIVNLICVSVHAEVTPPQGRQYYNTATGLSLTYPTCTSGVRVWSSGFPDRQYYEPISEEFYMRNSSFGGFSTQIGRCQGTNVLLMLRDYCPNNSNIIVGGIAGTNEYGNYNYYYCYYNQPCSEGTTRNPTTGQCEISKKYKNCPSSGNPINVGIGSKWATDEDKSSNAFGSIEFRRHYNYDKNRTATLSDIGVNWSHSYLRRINLDTKSGLWLESIRPDGQVYRYIFSATYWLPNGGFDYGDHRWRPDDDIHDKLVRLENDHIVPNGWQYTVGATNEVELYDATGTLQSITDPAGNTQTLSYKTDGRLDRVDTNTGSYLVFGYDTNNRIATLTDHTNHVWGYRYDALGNLEYVDNPDNTTKRYHYEDSRFPHALTGITDERGIRYATYGYDDQGRANLSTHANSAQRVDILYNADGTRTVTNSRNQSSTYSTATQLGVALVTNIAGPGCSTCGSGNTSYNYDPANNNLLSKIENGITTQYGNYDNKGQYGYKIEAVGTPQQRRTDYTYDPRFYKKIATITEPSVSSGRSKVTTYSYDDWGNRLTETISGFKPDATVVSRTITYQYNGPLHQLSQIDGPRTDVSDLTAYAYYADDVAQGNNRARLQRVTDAKGVAVRDAIQYTATGKVLSETRPNGLALSYTYYPGNDRLETLTESDGTSSRVTRWTYLATGEVETITQGYGTVSATTLTFGYDDARRLTRLTDGLGNYIEYTLDTEGNRESERTYDSSGVLKKQLAQTFDLYNRLDTTAQANETTDPSYAPDGTLDMQTDGKGVITDYSYDALKRVTQAEQDQVGTDPTTANATTGYGYDSADRLTSVTDPVNGNTTYVYDDLGNLLSQTSPDTGTTTFTYDGAGNLKTRKDAKAQLFTYSYDVLNRQTLADGPSTADDISYVYDTCTKGIGRLCSVTRVSETASYSYDAFGGVTVHQGVSYAYDAVGRLSTVTYPDTSKVVYSYDAAGQITRVEHIRSGTTTVMLSNATYHPFGPVSSGLFGNGKSLSVAVDEAYRSGARTSGPYSETINTATGYDANGNLLAYTGTESPAFSYDALDRLATANAASFGSRDYDYDKNGNRTQLTAGGSVTSYAYTPNSNRLSSLGGAAVTRDTNGNTTGQGTWTYTYDKHNRLTKAYNSGTLKVTYTYNGLGQRVKKAVAGGSTTRYVYGLNGQLLAETSGSGTVQRIYIYLNDTPLALLIGTTPYYIHTDHLGTPKALTSKNGTKVWSATHDPFGKATVNEDPDGNGNKITFNLRFPGQYYDAETVLHYNYFRTYDPGTGRYLESDPIGLRGGLNTYAYVSGNPLTKIDPQGLVECGWWNDNCSRGDPPNSPPTCVTPECAAGLPPIPPSEPLTPEEKCRYACSSVAGSTCSSLFRGGVNVVSAGAWLACRAAVAKTCAEKCDEALCSK